MTVSGALKTSTKNITKICLAKNGRDVIILLSSNGKFYGDLVTKSIRLFMLKQKVKMSPDHCRREGKSFYDDSVLKTLCLFEIPDTNIPSKR